MTCSVYTSIESPPQQGSVFDNVLSPNSPLFTAQTATSVHKRSVVVMFVGKVPIDISRSSDVPYILQRIPDLLDKAESLVQRSNTVNASCLLEIFTDALRIRLLRRTFQYTTDGLLFVDILNDDTRFFFVITCGRKRGSDVRINFQTQSLRSSRLKTGSSG